MSRKLPGSAIVPGTITVTQITGGLNDTTNASYAQANTARTTANDAYGQANTARDQANTARTQANTAYDQANNARGQANTAYGQANAAYGQANAAYGAANTRLSASGGTLSGDLIITGNLTVSGNQTILNTEVLTTEDAEIILLSNTAGTPALNAGLIINRGTSTNTFLRWNETLDEWGWSDSGTTTYYFEDLRAGLATTNTTFGTVNTSLGTINTSYQAAYAQANTAGTNALNAYGAANNRVLKAGDTMTGQLNISAGGLLVTGNVGFNTAAPQSRLEVNLISGDSNSLMNANSVNDVALLRAPFGVNPASASNGQAKWGLRFVGRNDGTYDNGKSAAVYAVSEETAAGYNRSVGLAFHTSSFDASHTERMRITNTGNVGIGTVNPNAALEVNGNIYLTSNLNFLLLGTNSAVNPYIQGDASGQKLYIGVNNGAAITINSSKNIGIGTTSPAAKLDVASASGAGNAIYFRGGTYTDIDYSTGIRFLQPAGTTNANRQFRFTSGASTLSIQGIVSSDGTDTADTQLILQPAGGNVGIGTASPQAKQHNYISSRSTAFSAGDGTTWHDLIIQNPNNTQGAAVGIAFELNSSYHSNAGTGIAAVKSTASSDYGADMVFVTRPQSAGAAECMRITSGGNIGIANTAPAVRLQIGNLSSVSTSSPETVSLGATFSSSAGGNPKLRVWTDGTNTIGLGVSSNQFDFIATGAYSHVFYQNGSERMRIDTSGHLVPGANATYNLGSTSLRWSTVYTSDLDLSNGIGDWTIVEGEDDLFIYNNKRNKVYKFKLEEVDPATAVPKKENL